MVQAEQAIYGPIDAVDDNDTVPNELLDEEPEDGGDGGDGGDDETDDAGDESES